LSLGYRNVDHVLRAFSIVKIWGILQLLMSISRIPKIFS
jgi:hypothetical protein